VRPDCNDHGQIPDRSHPLPHSQGLSAAEAVEAFCKQLSLVCHAARGFLAEPNISALMELTCAWGVLEARLELLRVTTRGRVRVRELWVVPVMRAARAELRGALENIAHPPDSKASALQLITQLTQLAARLDPHERLTPMAASALAARGDKETS
jgi:hypothetical protein